MKKILHVVSTAVKSVADECDLSFVPPMTKRRFSPLQKVVFALLNKVAPKGLSPKVVFASQYGEEKLTSDIVSAFNEDGDVSPWKFSSSVYNASVGLYSVFAGNHSTYTAIAAENETVENSLVEALFESGGAVWCYAEERDGGYGAAIRFEEVAASEAASWKVEVNTGDCGETTISYEQIVMFINGQIDRLTGNRISLSRIV